MSKYRNIFNAFDLKPLRFGVEIQGGNAKSWKLLYERRFLALSGFPEEYLDFLLEFPDTSRFYREVVFLPQVSSPYSGGEPEIITTLFGFSWKPSFCIFNVWDMASEWGVPDGVYVIGEVSGGNFICLDRRDSFSVKIFDRTVVDANNECLFLISPSFEDFVGLLYVDESLGNAVEGGPVVVSMTISDDLMKKADAFKKKYKIGKYKV